MKNFVPTGENFYASKSSFLKGLWRRLSPPTLTIKKNYSVAIVVCNNSENIVTSKNLFAKKPKIVRELIQKSSRTICKKFANFFQLLREHCFKPPQTTRKTGIKQLLNQGPQMLTSTKCTFVPHNMYFCALRNVLLCSTGPSTVFDGSDSRALRVRHLCPTGPTPVPHDRYFIILCKLCACVSWCFSDSFGSLKITYGWKKIYSRYKFTGNRIYFSFFPYTHFFILF